MQKGKNLKKEWDDFIETGNDRSFYILYGHYHDYLIYISLQKDISLDQAKDCVNDLFLYIFENRTRLAHIKQHHNYLVTSFVRKLFRKGRFNRLQSLSASDNSIFDEMIPPVTEPFGPEPSEEGQLSQIVKAYIGKLSYRQAKMIYQKFYIGLSYEEIAAANGVSIKTAYNTILQAIVKLRNLIGPERTRSLKAAVFSLAHLFVF
ncbi:RNA polymerase sigma factor [Parafilimonas sp.]|uniref:RNA polymerase sigma factor n=1 Tax=Parafilimonas sp. TaxID=1969739 RepID=UPI0039E6A77C